MNSGDAVDWIGEGLGVLDGELLRRGPTDVAGDVCSKR